MDKDISHGIGRSHTEAIHQNVRNDSILRDYHGPSSWVDSISLYHKFTSDIVILRSHVYIIH